MAMSVERQPSDLSDKCAFNRLSSLHIPRTSTSLNHLLQPLSTIEPSALAIVDRGTYISPRSHHLSSPYRSSNRTLPSPLRPKPHPTKSAEHERCSAEPCSPDLIPHDSPLAMSGYYYDPNDEESTDLQQHQHQQQQQQQQHQHQQHASTPSRFPIQHQHPQYHHGHHPHQQLQSGAFGMNMNPQFPAYTASPVTSVHDLPQQRYMVDPQNLGQHHQQPHHFSSGMVTAAQHQSWSLPTSGQPTYGYSEYQQPASDYSSAYPIMPQQFGDPSAAYLSPPPVIAGPSRPRPNRTASNASHASYASSVSYTTDNSRSGSPSVAEMTRWGVQNADGTYSCSYRGCTSKSRFTRGCDLRKHYKRHTKSLFCRYDGCPQSKTGGFSSNKDRMRHEQKHNPNVRCEWAGCDRMFSRVDNMKDHVRRVHLKYSSAG